MELRVLHYFVAIVQAKNISKAAESLHVSQPALSRQIKQLEDEVGQTLFERGHRQIHLTSAGYYLYQRATEILDLVDKTKYKLAQPEIISGTLDLGAGESIGLQPIMDVISQILHAYPDVHINLRSADSFGIEHKLDQGLLDFGIIMGEQSAKINDYNYFPLKSKNRWGVLMPADHPLTKKEKIQASDLLDQPLLMPLRINQMNSLRVWAGSNLEHYQIVGTYNLTFNAALLAHTGACLVLTYEGNANLETIGNLAFRPLAPALLDSNALIWKKDACLSPLSKLFLNLVKQANTES
ncbi:MAG: LysR family transcriptional regulator [Lactobacillus sp.]|jgi:DNA-binding transcriptional LysR family regulator|nr:LysR family transcriptional regulator [Lactobacillus sp.]MCI1943229.1 LysR family transcriptional regulator [Lactobacillus sp.]MCI1973166.1 LysR family transcriptional regulator [Lactobacillus sp.]